MNLAASIYRSVRRFPERVACVEGQHELSYREFHDRAMAVAGYFLRRGLKPGERVAAYLPNGLDEIVLAYATWWAGGVFVPLNVRFGADELARVLDDVHPRWVAVRAGDLSRIGPLSWPLLVVGQVDQSRGVSLNTLYHSEPITGAPMISRQDGDLALLMYTSGTTGRPKGVCQTHRNNTASAEMVIDAWNVDADDRFLLTMPLFHVGGMQCAMLPALFSGAAVIVLAKWSAQEWIRLAHVYRDSMTGLVPTMLIDVVQWARTHPGQVPDLSGFRLVATGGAATPPAVLDDFERLTGLSLVELYGQTELTGLAVTYRSGEKRRPGSMGRVQSQVVEAQVLDCHGTPLPPGSQGVGELVFRGETVTPGYWQNDAKTAERLIDGWLYTKDMVRWDQDGFLYYVDRADDMIICGGENIYPTEIEATLARHPAVAQVAVIGTPHERWGQQVTAIVVSRDASLTEEGVRRFLGKKAGYPGTNGRDVSNGFRVCR